MKWLQMREKRPGIRHLSTFQLALRYALLGSRPVVLICMGRVGTGKSTLANHLGEGTGH
jgi:predicted GTPase